VGRNVQQQETVRGDHQTAEANGSRICEKPQEEQYREVKHNLALIEQSVRALFYFMCAEVSFPEMWERGGQRAVRADGTRPIKSQRFLFHQRRR